MQAAAPVAHGGLTAGTAGAGAGAAARRGEEIAGGIAVAEPTAIGLGGGRRSMRRGAVRLRVAVGGDVAVAAAQGLELLQRLGRGADATLGAAVRPVMRTIVLVFAEKRGDFGGGGEIVAGGRAVFAKAFPTAQLGEAGEADAVALGQAGGGNGEAHGLPAAAILVLGRAIVGDHGEPAIDLGGEFHHGSVAG